MILHTHTHTNTLTVISVSLGVSGASWCYGGDAATTPLQKVLDRLRRHGNIKTEEEART